ncbi:hypothetical protein IT402_01160 [Candidatus Nomurabacteria bacterium]|nr:hypothetical protein [Candidatus Nomurabacteria bacterium]
MSNGDEFAEDRPVVYSKRKAMISVLNNIDPNTPHGKMMLAAASTNDISDEQFEKILMDHDVPVDPEQSGLKNLLKIFDVIQINRPELYKKLEDNVSKVKSSIQ